MSGPLAGLQVINLLLTDYLGRAFHPVGHLFDGENAILTLKSVTVLILNRCLKRFDDRRNLLLGHLTDRLPASGHS